MNIRTEKGTNLDVGKDFELNIQLTNPLLTDQGSSSLPLVIPENATNMRELDFPNRFDRVSKLKKKIPIVFESGIMQKQAILEIMSYQGKKDGLESVLLLDEAKMYTKMQEISMSTAFTNIIRKPQDISLSGSFDEPIDKLIKYLELVMLGQKTDDFHLFLVSTDYSDITWTSDRGGRTHTYQLHNFLNEQMSDGYGGNNSDILDTDLEGNEYAVFRGRKEFRATSGNEEYDVPKGYGITPFLKESYVLRQIFKYFGYELIPSIFDTDPDLKKVVLLSNTADAIVNGIIDYSQLVPSCTIHEYLETVRARFGCEFFVSDDHKTIVPVFWKDILKSVPTKDYTTKINGEIQIEYTTPKQLKLCYKRSLSFAEMTIDTFDKFEKQCGPIIDYFEKDLPGNIWNEKYYADGYYFLQSDCSIYERYTRIYPGTGLPIQEWRFFMRAMFDYYIEGEDTEFDEHSSNLEYTPVVYTDYRFTEASGYGYRKVLFIGERRHLNTAIKVIVTKEDGTTDTTEKKESPGSCPIMAAFWRKDLGIAHGSMHRYNYDGEIVGNFNLTFGGPDGLYEFFWKEYNEVIKSSFLKIIANLHLSELEIANYRMDELVLIEGQVLLPELLEYTMVKDQIISHKAEFRTVKLYKDLDS